MWVSFVMERNKQDEKQAAELQMCGNELGQKEDYPKDPLMDTNGRLNNI